MKFRGLLFCVAAGVCLIGGVAHAQAPAAGSVPGDVGGSGAATRPAVGQGELTREGLFEWFDGLGYPELKGKVFVRLKVGIWADEWDDEGEIKKDTGKDQGIYRYGWLTREVKGEPLELLTLDLFRESYPVKVPVVSGVSGEVKEEVWDYKKEEVDLKKYALEWLATARKQEKDDDYYARRGSNGRRMSVRGEGFVLARALALTGEDALSREMFDFIQTVRKYADEEGKNIRQMLAADLAYIGLWSAVLSISDASKTREALASEFERLVKDFPREEQTKEAQAFAAKIRAVIEADKKRVVKEWGAMTADERAREWTHRLCIQDPVAGEAGERPQAALAKMGMEAVPALIDALEDEAPTRQVASYRDHYYTCRVSAVGDVAMVMLWQLAKRRLYGKSGERAEVKREAQAWWKEVQAKGEKQVAVEWVEAGGEDVYELAGYLVEKHPEEAFAAIVRGYGNAKGQETRKTLMYMAGRLQSEASTLWLMGILKDGKDVQTRLSAASCLRMRKGPLNPEVMDAVLAEWEKLKHLGPETETGYNTLIDFLSKAGEVRAVAALAKDLDKRPVKARTHILLALEAYPGAWPAEQERRVTTDAAALAVEALWVAYLGDKERHEGLGLSEIDSPRVCDVAGIKLKGAWPERYKFSARGATRQRDRQLAVMRNVWLKSRGEAELPLPAEPVVE